MALHTLPELEKIPSSEFKKPGWRGVLDRLTQTATGGLVITSHQRSQGVLLTTEAYNRLVELASRQAPEDQAVLTALQRDFDQRLAGLTDPGASDRIRQATSEPLALNGQFRVGESH